MDRPAAASQGMRNRIKLTSGEAIHHGEVSPAAGCLASEENRAFLQDICGASSSAAAARMLE
jgi:hypothetical protein